MSKTKQKNKLSKERTKSLKEERNKILKWGNYLARLSDDIAEIAETEDEAAGRNWYW